MPAAPPGLIGGSFFRAIEVRGANCVCVPGAAADCALASTLPATMTLATNNAITPRFKQGSQVRLPVSLAPRMTAAGSATLRDFHETRMTGGAMTVAIGLYGWARGYTERF